MWGQHDKALDYFQQALELARKLGREADIALCLNNIGAVYYNQQKYPEAISYFVKSVELKERLRKTATGDVRREYLASQIYTYEFLISCYIRTGDFAKAFQIIELGRAKRLTEQLAGTDEVSIPSLEHIQ
jgi:pentatricopeptide repeat protein